MPSSHLIATAWWLNDGDQECSHCGRLYFQEVEVRCFECDQSGCPHCQVTHTEGYLVCPGCCPESSGSADGESHRDDA